MSTEHTGPSPARASAAPDAWAGQARISRQLAAWSVVSILGGSATALAGHIRGNRAVRAFGAQNAAWGAVDLGIAGFGEMRRRGRLATIEDPHQARVQDDEWRSLRRILLVNAGLDVGYVAAGAGGLARSLRRAQRPLPAMAGHCAAVVVQGGFLLVFDAAHARRASNAQRRSSCG
jgi:hypothetical protein